MLPTIPNNHKSEIRSKVWTNLLKVSIPDSRFHNDFSSFIPDFQGSLEATQLLATLPAYRSAKTIFIAPDNCLQTLRYQALKDGKILLVTTYGIRRGFWLLNPNIIPESKWEMSSSLDWMEKLGQHISLVQIQANFEKIDMMVTGTGAINLQGMRFGKGHGFFDIEWAVLWELGVVDRETCTVAVVHECQVLDEELRGEVWDTVCEVVVTQKRIILVEEGRKPDCGILWDRLESGMVEDIEPLEELRRIKG